MLKKSQIHRLITLFQESFKILKVEVDPEICEKYAVFIHSCMNNGRRKFHTTQHVLEVCEQMKALQILAGLFHDVVYYQVDEGFPSEAEILIRQIVAEKNGQIYLKETLPNDINLNICLHIFDFKLGQELGIHSGLNEFLSTWLAINYLSDFLTIKDLITVMVCIEATIPFRPKDEKGLNCLDHLENRVKNISANYQLNLSAEEIIEVVKLATGLANRDVENFSGKDPGKFLDNTWILLPETNENLWNPGVYFHADYRIALTKMEGFLSFLNPENIFHQYKNTPNDEDFIQMKVQAHKNVQIAKDYLQAKILAIAIIEALALSTGGDAPISMFLGDVVEYGTIERAEDYLPKIVLSDKLEYDDILYHLLEYGRASETSFDLKNSPIASFVYKYLGNQNMEKSMNLAHQMFKEKITPEEFLQALDNSLVGYLAKACAKLATTREKALMKWF